MRYGVFRAGIHRVPFISREILFELLQLILLRWLRDLIQRTKQGSRMISDDPSKLRATFPVRLNLLCVFMSEMSNPPEWSVIAYIHNLDDLEYGPSNSLDVWYILQQVAHFPGDTQSCNPSGIGSVCVQMSLSLLWAWPRTGRSVSGGKCLWNVQKRHSRWLSIRDWTNNVVCGKATQKATCITPVMDLAMNTLISTLSTLQFRRQCTWYPH